MGDQAVGKRAAGATLGLGILSIALMAGMGTYVVIGFVKAKHGGELLQPPLPFLPLFLMFWAEMLFSVLGVTVGVTHLSTEQTFRYRAAIGTVLSLMGWVLTVVIVATVAYLLRMVVLLIMAMMSEAFTSGFTAGG